MTFRDLLSILEAEYHRRTGVLPDQPWRRWLFTPWVAAFLRTYTPPVPKLAGWQKGKS